MAEHTDTSKMDKQAATRAEQSLSTDQSPSSSLAKAQTAKARTPSQDREAVPVEPSSHTTSRRSGVSQRTLADTRPTSASANHSTEETRIGTPGRRKKGEGRGQEEQLVPAGSSEKGDATQLTPAGQDFTFPDGGREAWLCLLGGFFAFFASFGIVSSSGAYQSYYEENFLSQLPSSTIAWIGSVTAFVSLGLAAVTGSFFDLYGHRPLVAVGTFVLVLSHCLLSLSTQYYQVLLCHTLSGVGIPLLFISSIGVVGQFFSRRRGLAFGMLTSGGSIGGAVWPILWANLPQKIGFPWTMRLIALILGVLGTAAFFLMKTRLPPKPPGPFFYFKAFKNLTYVCLCVCASAWACGYFTSMTFVGTYGRLLELGDVTPYLLLNAASGIGRLLVACISDRVGAYNITIIGNIIMVILFYCWLAAKTGTSLIVINVLYGIASGAYISLQAPMITRLADDMRYAGTMVGQVMMFQSVSQLVGPPIAGALFGSGTREEQLGNFPRLIVFGSLLLTLATGAVILARFKLDRKWRVVV